MERTNEEKQYLKNKHKGGENNQKGGVFEDFYAVYQIVSCIGSNERHLLDSVVFQTQLENTFVDDMLIVNSELKTYYQLKNTKSLSWGKVDKLGDIASDFAHQIEDCRERNEKFALKLVYSLKDSKVGEQIPEKIKEYTSADFFDYSADLNSLIIVNEPLRKALKAISPNGNKTTTDDLANMASMFLGIWKGCNSKDKISLNKIIDTAAKFKHINLKIYSDAVLNEDCKKILDAIDDFEYHIIGRMLYWSVGLMTGSCPWPDNIENDIIIQHPTNKWDLISMLS